MMDLFRKYHWHWTMLFIALILIFIVLLAFLMTLIPDTGLLKTKLISKGELPVSQTFKISEGHTYSAHFLKNYLLFSKEEEIYKDYLENLIRDKIVELSSSKKDLTLHRDLLLKEIKENGCSTPNCFQHRISFDLIPPLFWKGLIGVEDYRFIDHKGLDYLSIARAFITNLREMRFAEGGSTLTQQLVKNLYLDSHKNIYRKAKEALLSMRIEREFSKEEILELYFNEAFFGTLQGLTIKGISAASLFYFAKSPAELTPMEVVILISLLKGPNFYSPLRQIDRLKDRVNAVLKRLIAIKVFPSDRRYYWGVRDWKLWREELLERERLRIYYPFYEISKMERVKTDLNDFEIYALIHSSRSLLQNLGTKAKGLSIKAIVGNPLRPLGRPTYYYSQVERNAQEAIEKEAHQIGSTVKPILYNLFLQNGKSLTDEVSTLPYELKMKKGQWAPRDHRPPEESVTLELALQKSFNIPVVRLTDEIGFDKIESGLQKYLPSLKLPLRDYPSQLLGAVELSPLSLYRAYENLLEEMCQAGDQPPLLMALSKPKETTVGGVLSDKLADASFFGKTGTTNNSLDNWFVFYDGLHLGVIWVGMERREEAKGDLHLAGSSTAFKIYQNYLLLTSSYSTQLICPKWEK